MELLVKNKYFILPTPKYIKIQKENGITLSSLLTIFLNKYRIKDNALLLSSKFNKHFNTFLNAIPIRDSDLDENWGENYFFTIITPESIYETKIKRDLNVLIENYIRQFENILNECCYELYPERLKSSLPLDESYYINISNGAIWIISSSARGFYYGIQTIIQIIEHTLFLFDKFEEFITLPEMQIVDFPGWIFRGINVDLNCFKPTIEALTNLVPFLMKYKFNNISLVHKSEFPYSQENQIKIQDLCEFHQIEFKDITELRLLDTKKLHLVKNCTKGGLFLPDYKKILSSISDLELDQVNKNGITVGIGGRVPLDLQILILPIIGELLWNPHFPLNMDFWKHSTNCAQISLFETNLLKNIDNFFDVFQSFINSSSTHDFICPVLEDLKTSAFENTHLIEALNWALKGRKLESDLLKLKEGISHKNIENLSVNEILKLKDYSNNYYELIDQGTRIFENSNHLEKGKFLKCVYSSDFTLKLLVESWIPTMLENHTSGA
ncbi:MAG: hypothetical protein JW776_09060 [Candidatus Lokiarchaeota archaeon]|nr:hypothetical protein [Candidatus Lokiarchaeota archaeon]